MNKSLRLAFLLSGLIISAALNAQEIEEEPPLKPATANAQQLYVELFGPGILYSINYDTRFGKKEKGWGMRAGFGATFAGGEGALIVPVGLNYLTGRQGNYFELGGGASLVTGEDVLEGAGVYGFLSMGYRRQAFKKKGVTWRIAFTPLMFFEDGFSFIPFAGASVGYRF